MKKLLLSFVLFCLPLLLSAQSVTVSNVDISGYPVISADVLVTGPDGLPVYSLNQSDLALTIGTIPVSIATVSCPPPPEPLPMWAVATSDKSLSMDLDITGTGLRRIEVAIQGLSSFVNTVQFTSGTKVALTTFDTTAYLLLNFTDQAVPLNTQVGNLQPNPVAGTDFNDALLHSVAGGITLLQNRAPTQVERVMVLLTDGQPNPPGSFDYNTAIQAAVAADVTVHVVVIADVAALELRQIAAATGGLVFDNVRSNEAIRESYQRIARWSQHSKTPCRITWSVDRCNDAPMHTARLRHQVYGVETTFSYSVASKLRPATVYTGNDTSLCRDASVPLRATGNAPGSYRWYPAEGLDNPASATPVASPVTTTTYTVVFTDNRGCIASDDITLTVVAPAVDITADSLFICQGERVPLSATGNGTSYSWFPVNGIDDPSSPSPTARPTSTTTYYLTALLGTCTAQDSVTVVVFDTGTGLDAGADTAVCEGGSVQLVPTGVEGTYTWFPPVGLDRTDVRSPIATPSVTTTYYATVTTGSGCTARDSVTVTVHPLPSVDAGPNQAVCPGGSAVINAQAGEGTYAWSPSDGLDAANRRTVTASPTRTTTYTVVYTDGNGCTAVDSVTVAVLGSLTVEAGPSRTLCPGSSVRLAVDAPAGSARWTPATGLDDATSRTPLASPDRTTVYVVTVTSPDGCTGTDSVQVVVHPGTTVDVGGDVSICRGESIRLSAAGSTGSYQWTPADGLDNPTSPSPVAAPEATTLYTVAVTDGNGCRAVDSVRVVVRPYALPRFSLAVPGGSAVPGRDIELAVQVDDIDPLQDTLTAFELVLSYDIPSMAYRTGTVVAAAAAADWTITAVEQPADGQLVLRGSGALLRPGTVCVLRMRPYLSALSARGIIPVTLAQVTVETPGCATPSGSGAVVRIEQPCVADSRAIRYTGRGYGLQQNAPNPAQHGTTISYSIALDAPTRLVLYTALGEELLVLADGFFPAGDYEVPVPVGDLPSGLYYYRLTSGPYTAVRQMILRR